MLHALSANTSLTSTTFRPQTARPQDSDNAMNVLPGAPATGVAGRIELLTDATELQPALMEAVNEAKTSIKVDFHLLKGAQGQELARQLARRARQGLRVQVLAWGQPTAAFTEAIKVARSQGLAVRQGRFEGPGVGTAVGRTLVADDRLAIVASLFSPTRTRHAKVGLLRITGEAACELGRQFNHDWAAAGGQPMSLPEMGLMARSATYETLSTIQVGGHGPQRRAAKALVLTALNRAQRAIEIMIDTLDDADVLAALVSAKGRGVNVKVLLSGHASLDTTGVLGFAKADGQTRAIATLGKVGVAVRRFHVGGIPQAVEVRFGLVDGETLLFGSMPWSMAGFASSGEVLVEARGGRELLAIRAGFHHDWANSLVAEAPSRLRRAAAEVVPALGELSRLMRRFSPAKPAQKLLNMQVGVVRYPGGKWKLIADVH